MIIQRPDEVKRIKEIKKWIIIYGRRKTGKTFILENFFSYDNYFFVKRDKTISSKDGNLPYEPFLILLKRDLQENKTVVIDEFHRLGDDFLDFLQNTKKEGKLILVSSTLHMSKKFFSGHSPILGFFAEVPVDIIGLKESVHALENSIKNKKQLVEMAVLLREPISISEFELKEPREIFKKLILSSINVVPALVGEIFAEEERSLSGIYEGILRAIANGKVVSSEISSSLFSSKLIQKDDPSVIQQHLGNLIKFGIIKRIQIYNKNKFAYKHVSPLLRLFYYADEKYNLSERRLQITEQEISRIIDEVMPRIVEDNIREFLAKKLGLVESILESGDYEVDGCLLKFKKPEIVFEVKWKDKIDLEDLKKAEENLNQVNAKRKFLFVPDKTKIKKENKFNLEIVDISDFI